MKNKKEKGSAILEAIIILPTIFMILFALLFAFQLTYQQVVLEYAASYGATRGAMMWQYDPNNVDFATGKADGRAGLYYDIEELFSGGMKADRKSMIERETKSIVDKLSIFSGNVKVESSYKGSLVGRTITVTVSQETAIPFASLVRYFSNDAGKLKASSSANLYDPDEYIRNLDYIYEISSSIIKQVKDHFGDIKENRKGG